MGAGPARLNWLRASDRYPVDKGCVGAAKELLLTSTGSARKPSDFQIKEGKGHLVSRLANKLGIYGAPAAIRVRDVAPGMYESEKPWPAGVSGAAQQSRYYFEDGLGGRSAYVTTSSQWVHVIDKAYEAGVEVPAELVFAATGVPARPSLRKGRREFSVGACTDPEVRVAMLLPWTDEQGGLLQFLSSRLDEIDPKRDRKADLRKAADGFLPEGPPKGWRFGIEPTHFSVDEKHDQEVVFWVEADQPGRMAFALKISYGDDPSQFVISSPVAVESA